MTSEKIMVTVNGVEKEKISIAAYGDLVVDCASSAVLTASGPTCLALVGIPAFLKYLDRIVVTPYPVKACASVAGATALGIYIARISRLNCEKLVSNKYQT